MDIDHSRAASFLAGSARLLDRRRFELLTGRTAAPDAVLAAVETYRNDDGGYGWGLEPDLRAPESQPATTPRAALLCDWLATVTLPDGGLPFALPIADPAGCAPFWADADPAVSTLQSTAFVAGTALRVARHDPAVAAHPWLETASRYCLRSIATLDGAPHAIALSFAVRFLDAAHGRYPEAPELLRRLGRHVPDDGHVPVEGGRAGETMRALDFATAPSSAAVALFRPEVIDTELDELAARQQDDGGWVVDFDSWSPVAAREWRGYATVGALLTLARFDRLRR